MSRQADEKRYAAKQQKSQRTDNRSRFCDFNAREEEKEDIRALGTDYTTISTSLDEIMDSGLRLSVSYDERGSAYKVLVYHEETPFDERVFVSFWASSVLWAMVQLVYCWRKGILSVEDGIVYRRQVKLGF